MADSRKLSVGILGATGQVGQEIARVLVERKFPMKSLQLFASAESKGKTSVDGLDIEIARGAAYSSLDLLFSASPRTVSEEQVAHARKAGVRVIDVSSAHRNSEDIPLVIPEINGDDLQDFDGGLFSSPSAPAIALSMVLDCLRGQALPIRVSGTLFMTASTEGRKGVEELAAQTIGLLNQSDVPSTIFPERLAFNLIPDVGGIDGAGEFSAVELSVVREVQRVLDEDELEMYLTATFVPIFSGLSLSLEIHFDEEVSAASLRGAFSQYDGIEVLDDPADKLYPLMTHIPETNEVWVGRIRSTGKKSCMLWVAMDNIRKGAATNAVQIAELVFKD